MEKVDFQIIQHISSHLLSKIVQFLKVYEVVKT
jgi:hypothetical protein